MDPYILTYISSLFRHCDDAWTLAEKATGVDRCKGRSRARGSAPVEQQQHAPGIQFGMIGCSSIPAYDFFRVLELALPRVKDLRGKMEPEV